MANGHSRQNALELQLLDKVLRLTRAHRETRLHVGRWLAAAEHDDSRPPPLRN